MRILRKRYYCEVEIIKNETDDEDAQTTNATNNRWYEIPSAQNALDATDAMARQLEQENVVGIVTIRIWTAIRAKTTTRQIGGETKQSVRAPYEIANPEQAKREEWYEIGRATVVC